MNPKPDTLKRFSKIDELVAWITKEKRRKDVNYQNQEGKKTHHHWPADKEIL